MKRVVLGRGMTCEDGLSYQFYLFCLKYDDPPVLGAYLTLLLRVLTSRQGFDSDWTFHDFCRHLFEVSQYLDFLSNFSKSINLFIIVEHDFELGILLTDLYDSLIIHHQKTNPVEIISTAYRTRICNSAKIVWSEFNYYKPAPPETCCFNLILSSMLKYPKPNHSNRCLGAHGFTNC